MVAMIAQREFRAVPNRACDLEVVIPTKVELLAIFGDLRLPLLIGGAPTNPNSTALIIVRNLLVKAIRFSVNITKVHDPVVGAISVDVVDVVRRPVARIDSPANPMGERRAVINVAMLVAVFLDATERLLPRISRIPRSAQAIIAEHFTGPRQPNKQARMGIVVNKLFEGLDTGRAAFSHGADPLRSGQGRAVCNHRFRPVFSSKIAAFPQGVPA